MQCIRFTVSASSVSHAAWNVWRWLHTPTLPRLSLSLFLRRSPPESGFPDRNFPGSPGYAPYPSVKVARGLRPRDQRGYCHICRASGTTSTLCCLSSTLFLWRSGSRSCLARCSCWPCSSLPIYATRYCTIMANAVGPGLSL